MIINESIRGTTITDKHIVNLFKECKDIYRDLGYVIDDDIYLIANNQLRNAGTCYWPEYSGGWFTIGLNEALLKESDDNIKTVMLHELGHYVQMNMLLSDGVAYWWSTSRLVYNNKLVKEYGKSYISSHGRQWQAIVNAVSRKTGLKITATYSRGEHPEINKADEDKLKYIVKCKNCGQEYKYARKTDFVKDPNATYFSKKLGKETCRWYCTKCGAEGQFEVINKNK